MLASLLLSACLCSGVSPVPAAPASTVSAATTSVSPAPVARGHHDHARHERHHHEHHEPDGCEHECAACCAGHAPVVAAPDPGALLLAPMPDAPCVSSETRLDVDPAPTRVFHVPRV